MAEKKVDLLGRLVDDIKHVFVDGDEPGKLNYAELGGPKIVDGEPIIYKGIITRLTYSQEVPVVPLKIVDTDAIDPGGKTRGAGLVGNPYTFGSGVLTMGLNTGEVASSNKLSRTYDWVFVTIQSIQNPATPIDVTGFVFFRLLLNGTPVTCWLPAPVNSTQANPPSFIGGGTSVYSVESELGPGVPGMYYGKFNDVQIWNAAPVQVGFQMTVGRLPAIFDPYPSPPPAPTSYVKSLQDFEFTMNAGTTVTDQAITQVNLAKTVVHMAGTVQGDAGATLTDLGVELKLTSNVNLRAIRQTSGFRAIFNAQVLEYA